MARCGSCGAETSRVLTHFEGPDGKPLKEPRDSCPQCKADEFPEFRARLELVPNWIANPHEYDTLEFEDGERVPIVKDWAKGEFEELVAEGPVARAEEQDAIERKRAFARERNLSPLTPEEIEQRKRYFREQFEHVERVMGAEAAGLVFA